MHVETSLLHPKHRSTMPLIPDGRDAQHSGRKPEERSIAITLHAKRWLTETSIKQGDGECDIAQKQDCTTLHRNRYFQPWSAWERGHSETTVSVTQSIKEFSFLLRIFVTGGTGIIGSALVPHLIENSEHEV